MRIIRDESLPEPIYVLTPEDVDDPALPVGLRFTAADWIKRTFTFALYGEHVPDYGPLVGGVPIYDDDVSDDDIVFLITDGRQYMLEFQGIKAGLVDSSLYSVTGYDSLYGHMRRYTCAPEDLLYVDKDATVIEPLDD